VSDSPALNMVDFMAEMFFETSSICLSVASFARSRIAIVFVTSSGAGRLLPRWSTCAEGSDQLFAHDELEYACENGARRTLSNILAALEGQGHMHSGGPGVMTAPWQPREG